MMGEVAVSVVVMVVFRVKVLLWGLLNKLFLKAFQ